MANSAEGGAEGAPGVVATHRVDLARALAAGVVAALGAGDVRGARLAVGALADLVEGCAEGAEGPHGATEPREGPEDASATGSAHVVDLGAARRRRER